MPATLRDRSKKNPFSPRNENKHQTNSHAANVQCSLKSGDAATFDGKNYSPAFASAAV
jgi:hypothetical protein